MKLKPGSTTTVAWLARGSGGGKELPYILVKMVQTNPRASNKIKKHELRKAKLASKSLKQRDR